MNYFKKYNPISDVDVIRILEHLDRGASFEEILENVAEENREEVKSILMLLEQLDESREIITSPKELFVSILDRITVAGQEDALHDAPVAMAAETSHPSSVFHDSHFVPYLQKFLMPLSVTAVIAALFVGGRLVTKEPIGSVAVSEELGISGTFDTFPEDEMRERPPETVTGAEKDALDAFFTAEDAETPQIKSAAPRENASRGASKSSEPTSAMPPGESAAPSEVDVSAVIAGELSDIPPVFSEDNFSVYFESLSDVPIDVIS